MYIFNHIPKTGGTSLYRLLERLIGPERLSPHFSLNEDVTYEVNAADYERYQVLYGHIGVVWNDLLRPGARWMTMLRDPVERILSQYYYWRNNIPWSPHLHYVNAAQTLPLESFLLLRDEKFQQGNMNAQTWQLADDYRFRYRKIRESEALEIAQKNLAERFAYIGIFEDYGDSVERLCRLFGVAQPEVIPVENRTRDRKRADQLDPEIAATIRELNPLDFALYDYAKELLRRQASQT